MKTKDCLLITFFCMCFSLGVLYGFFELNGVCMMKDGKLLATVILGSFIIICGISICMIWKNKTYDLCIKKDKIVLCGNSFSSIYVAEDDNIEIPEDSEAVVITGNFCLCKSHFENANTSRIKKIYFCNKKHRIDADLFECVKDKIIIMDKGKIIIEIN